MTRPQPDLDDHDDLHDLSRRLHELADRWEVTPPIERPDLVARRRSWRPDWLPAWAGSGIVPALAGLAIVALAVAASLWLSTLSDRPDVVEHDATGAAALLDEVPADVVRDGPVVVTIGDLDAATDLAGVDRPNGSSTDGADEWLLRAISGGDETTTGDVAYVDLPFPSVDWWDLAGWEDELGWSLVDVSRFVDVSASSVLGQDVGPLLIGDRFTVFTGPAATTPPPPDLAEAGDGVVRAGGPGDACNLNESTPARRQGCPLYLAQDGDRLLTASSTELVDAWRTDERPTLADDADIVAVVDALGSSWTTVQVRRDDFSRGPASDPGMSDDDVLPAPFEVVGLAWAGDADGAVVTVAYLHADADDATRNAGALERVWGGRSVASSTTLDERLDVEAVGTDGRLATVTLRPLADQDNSAAFLETYTGAPFLHASGADDTTTDGDRDALGPTDDEGDTFEAWMNGLPSAEEDVVVGTEARGPARSQLGATSDDVGSWPSVSHGDGFTSVPVTIHAVCRGTGTATIGFDDAAVEPAPSFACDGSTVTVTRVVPSSSTRVGLIAEEDPEAEVWLAVLADEADVSDRQD